MGPLGLLCGVDFEKEKEKSGIHFGERFIGVATRLLSTLIFCDPTHNEFRYENKVVT